MRKQWVIGLGGLAALGLGFLAIQLIPIGVQANPPVLQEPAWDSPRTRELAARAGCLDCHSNETVWPWYAQVAPVSWWVAEHVVEGREHLNLSEMNRPQDDADEAGEAVREGEMPPAYYVLMHPEARLSDAERAELVAGLDATLGGETHADHGGGHGDDDDDSDD